MSAPGFWRSHWRQSLALILLAFALYGVTLSYGFVLDDKMVITENDFTKKGFAGIPQILTTDSFEGHLGKGSALVAGGRYRPLSIVCFAVEYALVGANSRVSHFLNVLLYALAGLLIFRVTSLLFDDRSTSPWFTVAFLTSVVYLAHPVHSEVVANVKGRDELLALIGALGALYAVLRYLEGRSFTWLALSGVFMFLGLLSKESAIGFLAVIPLAVFFFFRVPRAVQVISITPCLIASVVYLLVRVVVLGYLFDHRVTSTSLLNDPFQGASFDERYATVFYTLALYVKLLVFPHPLTHDYYPFHISVMGWSRGESILGLLLYVAMLSYAALGVAAKKVGAFCVLYFVATLFLASNLLFPVGTFMNERFLFMPSLAFCMIVAYGLSEKLYPRSRTAALSVALLVLLGFSGATMARVPAWKDSLSLARAGVAVSKNSAHANRSMANALREHGDFDEATHYADRALELIPDDLVANQIKSVLLAEQYRLDHDLDQLLQGLEQVLNRQPDVEYIPRLAAYINRSDPDKRRLADFYHRVGYEICFLKKRRYDLALKYLSLGLQLDPTDPRINFAIGRSYQALGDTQRADAFLSEAYRVNPALGPGPGSGER